LTKSGQNNATKSGKILIAPSFIRLKRSYPELQETTIDVWQHRCNVTVTAAVIETPLSPLMEASKNGSSNEPLRGNTLLSTSFSKKWVRDVAGASSWSNWRIWIGDEHSQEVKVDAGRCERG
jgi:hypothetical protein